MRDAVKQALNAQPPPPPGVAKLLGWFGNEAAKRDFHPTVQVIRSECFDGTTVNVKNLFTATRKWLREYRLRDETQGQVVMDVPPAPQRGPLESSYTLLFIRAASAGRGATSLRTSAVIRFWELMTHAFQTHRVVVIYNTPDVRTPGGPSNDADLWTGMGEAEAALLIGEHLSQIQPRVRLSIRRWRDIKRVELKTEGRCMILLGTALGQPDMEYLCDRDRWRPLQKFHFTPSLNGGRCFIHRGRKPSGPMTPHGPYQYREALSKGGETDFALISVFRDEAHQQTLIGLQGISTIGTLGAARFMFDEAAVRHLRDELQKRSVGSIKNSIPSFELILKIPVNEADRLPEEAQFDKLELYKA